MTINNSMISTINTYIIAYKLVLIESISNFNDLAQTLINKVMLPVPRERMNINW
jgi:hypothetical protein